jgi:hypothetical protein
MSTILETMNNINENIEETFSELIKLVLRKTIRPILNPLGPNTRQVYNPLTNRFERGFVGFDPSDSINKYTYHIVTSALGWTNNIVVVFRITPKVMPNPLVGNGQVRRPRLAVPPT